VQEGSEYHSPNLIPVLQQVLRDNDIKTKKTVISFPVKFPWIRVLEVPQASERDMDRIVRLEVERLYLDSTVEKLIDYHPLGPAESNATGNNISVLSCAIPRNSVVPYTDLLQQAKLELIGVDLGEVNVLKLAGMQGIRFDEGITLILNFNMQSTDLMLMENNRLQLVRKVGQGKEQLRSVLSRNLPEDAPARQMMQTIDFRLPEEYLHFSTEFVAALLGEIRRSIEFYLTDIKRAEGNVSKIVLAGSGYWPTNLPDILAQQLHLPMVDLRFDNMREVQTEISFKEDFPTCAVYAPVLGSVIRGSMQ